MTDKKVEKWEYKKDNVLSVHEVWCRDQWIATSPKKEYADRIANLPRLEDEHRKMRELLEEILGDLPSFQEDGYSDAEVAQYYIEKTKTLLAEMEG